MASAASPPPSAAVAAVAAAAAPDLSGDPSTPHNHPSYEDMILQAIASLKGRRGSSWFAISKYISDHYSDLPPTHATLLSHHLRLLHSKGSIRMLKLCYKLQDGSPKPPPSSSVQPKRRGRPPKLLSAASAAAEAPPANGPVYIISQAEQLSSGLLQRFPGAVAIVVPRSLLTERAARSPIVILPRGIQSLVDASAGRRKKGGVGVGGGERKKRGRPRKEEGGVLKEEVGRPWKIRDLLVRGNGKEVLGKSGEMGRLETGLEGKKRPVGRPRKRPLIEGPGSGSGSGSLSDALVK